MCQCVPDKLKWQPKTRLSDDIQCVWAVNLDLLFLLVYYHF